MSNQTPAKPAVSSALLEYLQHLFPDRCPDLDVPDRKVWWNAGASAVVKHLERIHREQAASALTSR